MILQLCYGHLDAKSEMSTQVTQCGEAYNP